MEHDWLDYSNMVVALIAFVIAVVSLKVSKDQLTLAVEAFNNDLNERRKEDSYRLKEAEEADKINRHQTWLQLRAVFASLDDIHTKFRPEGDWSKPGKGPTTVEEKARTELYMGLFEFSKDLLDNKLLSEEQFRNWYLYRLKNVTRNEWVQKKKLDEQRDGWVKYRSLCQMFNVPIPK